MLHPNTCPFCGFSKTLGLCTCGTAKNKLSRPWPFDFEKMEIISCEEAPNGEYVPKKSESEKDV